MQYSDIQSMTNAEAVAYYSPLTNSYIPCGDLENLLDWAGKAKRNPVTGAFEGLLIDFMNSNAVPELSNGLAELFSHLNKPRSIGCDTHEQPWGRKMADLLAGLEAAGQVDAQLTVEVVALGGGYAYPGITEAYVQTVRDDQQTQEEMEAVENKYVNLYNRNIAPLLDANNPDDAAWQAALNAMASEWGS